ncbi:MAG: UDP-N-acetylmuramoyl-L-alanyl-D-glutamate--2,6-diaminopimelate ligase [Ruminococcaceae bacterium]|nr:UDP-N-acetylmuramoyl-L-alanyl-D-glutamate--2,6-diaminopimelate ligase [Oscillospiraceae bacterium]
MRFGELFDSAGRLEHIPVEGIFKDSRKMKKNGLFVCLKGTKEDGHQFAAQAAENGASVIIAQEKISVGVPVVYVEDTAAALVEVSRRFYKNPARRLKLIGVTGTNGKTTVTHFIKAILEAAGKKVGLIGTNGIFVGNQPLDIERTMPTTPDALELQEIFAKMCDEQAEYVVMEVSSHAIAQGRIRDLQFVCSVFTNLSRDHLDYHKTMQAYQATKAKLFSVSDRAVINIDDAAGREIAFRCTCPVLTVGVHDAAITAGAISLEAHGSRFIAEEGDGRFPIQFCFLGRFNIYNALCAIGAARSLGIGYDAIQKGLSGLGGVAGRLEAVGTDGRFSVLIDYAHSPDGLENVLHTVRGFCRGRIILVFGCGGDRDRTKRPIMGEIAGRLADVSVITSDNPRTENPETILAEICSGMRRARGEYVAIADRKEAIFYALTRARAQDVVLLAGKGQETYQIVGYEKHHFDEREIVNEWFLKIKIKE